MQTPQSAGIFVEEVPSNTQLVQAVSTSNVAVIGFTKRGPTDKATLATSYAEFEKSFGGLTRDSFVAYNVAAFFANGGRRAYIVRVVPSDALAAQAKIQSKTYDQVVETGDGVAVTFTKTLTTSLLKDNAGASPIASGTLTMKWRAAGAPAAASPLRNRANGANLTGDGVLTKFEFRVNPAAIPAVEANLFCVVPGTATLNWDDGAPKTLAITAPVSGSVSTVTSAGTTVTLDHATGFGSVVFSAAPAAASAITMDLTPATATKTITESASTLTGAALTGPGTISLSDGSYSFTTNAGDKPHDKSPVLANYKINAWTLDPVAKGKWGNDLKVVVKGNADSYTASTNTFSKFDVEVHLKNDAGSYEVVEHFDELVLNDATSVDFMPDVINEMSDMISVVEPGGNEAPGQLNGLARTLVIAGGDETIGGGTITATLGALSKRSLSITYTNAAGLVRTITDGGAGILAGDVDTTTSPTVNYTTGALSFKIKAGDTIKAGTVMTATWRTTAEETSHSEVFGDTTKSFTAGTDGTFTTGTYGRSQISDSATLESSYKGVYALNKVDEMMSVIVPDFVGDTTITADLLTYADTRAAQASGGDRFIILAAPKGSSYTEAADWVPYKLGQYSNFAAIYWPWVKVADPLANNRPLTVPPLGHIAGVYARTDASKNIGKAPGGTVDGALRYLTGLESENTLAERDVVYQKRVNPLISSPQTGLAVWGVRTISTDSDWRYINARRLFMFLEKSIYNSTHWIVFENNGPALWSKIKGQINGFLTNLFNEGYFAGTSPSQAFFVTCDDTNNTETTRNNGEVIIDIGVAPNKPAEFVRFRFTQKTLS